MNLRHIEIFHAVYVNGSVSAAAKVSPGLAQRVDPVLDLADLDEQQMRVLGRHQPAIGALEELETEQAFRVAQHLRHRRLRHVERPGGGADGTVDVDGVEDLDVSQIHAGSVIPSARFDKRARRPRR